MPTSHIDARVGDIGFRFLLTIGDQSGTIIDLSTASTKNIIFRKPNGTTVTVEAQFATDGSDGKLQYVTPDVNFLNISGHWELQAFVIYDVGSFHSTRHNFEIGSNLE